MLDFILYIVVHENAHFKVCCMRLSQDYPELNHYCFDLKICHSLTNLNFKVVKFVCAKVQNYILKFTIILFDCVICNIQCNNIVYFVT